MAKNTKPIWIKEAEAAELLGIKDPKTLRRYVSGANPKLAITTSKVVFKGEMFYDKNDIESLLMQHAKVA